VKETDYNSDKSGYEPARPTGCIPYILIPAGLIAIIWGLNYTHNYLATQKAYRQCEESGGIRINQIIDKSMLVIPVDHRNYGKFEKKMNPNIGRNCKDSPACKLYQEENAKFDIHFIKGVSKEASKDNVFLLYEGYYIIDPWFPQLLSSGWELYDVNAKKIIASELSYGLNGSFLYHISIGGLVSDTDGNICYPDYQRNPEFGGPGMPFFNDRVFRKKPFNSIRYPARDRNPRRSLGTYRSRWKTGYGEEAK